MRILFCVIFLFPVILIAQNDTIYSKNKNVISINESGIDFLVTKYEKLLLNRNGINGWRLQLKFKAKESEITRLKTEFIRFYPEIPVYLEYENPYYRIRVGDCRTKLEALKIKHLINKRFPNTYPVPEVINITKIK